MTPHFRMVKKNCGVGPIGGGSIWSIVAAGRGRGTPTPKRMSTTVARVSAASSSSGSTGPSDSKMGKRGSFAEAVAAASTAEGLDAAVQELLRDRFAASTLRTRNSWLGTWLSFHQLVDERRGMTTQPFPLTVTRLHEIAALFKAG